MALFKALLAGLFVWLLCVLAFAPLTHAGIKAAFFYQWFPNTWAVNGSHVFYHPTLGYYSSDDQAVADQQIKWLGNVPFDAWISSWWGPGQQGEASRLPLFLNRTQALRPKMRGTLYYEREGYADPTVAELQSDLTYLSGYTSHAQWLRVNGKPVIFVYGGESCAGVDRWKAAAPNWYVVLKVFSGFASCPNQPDSWHQYAPASAVQSHPPYSYVISPGFWRADEPTPRLARDLTRWKTNAAAWAASTAQWQLVTTFNEWGEGTSVEPATEWTNVSCGAACSHGAYLHVLWKALQPPPPPPPPSGDPVVAAAGDIANPCSAGSPPSGAVATASVLNTINPNYVLPLGDLQYESGALTAFNNCYHPTWGQKKAITKPSPGNHDPCPGSGYDEYFGALAPGCWYSYDLGQWHLISLDSNVPSNSTQLGWLTNDLASNNKSCVLAYWHHPRYSSGNYSPGISSVQPFLDRLAGKVEVVLNGHDHNYERFALRNGYRQFIVGTGGRSHYVQGTPQPFSEVRNSTAYGVLKLTLHSSSYDWNFKPIAGQSFTDAGSGVCS